MYCRFICRSTVSLSIVLLFPVYAYYLYNQFMFLMRPGVIILVHIGVEITVPNAFSCREI